MKFVTGLLAAVLLLAGVGASHAVVRIADDRGGRIGTYVDKYQGLRTSGETVIIDGLCASACTIVLGAVPHDKICVTSHANLGFHAAWDFGANGRAVTNPEATQMLYSMYPSQVRRWIAQRGGLTPQMIFLRGKQLLACTSPATSTPRHPRRGRRRAGIAPFGQHDVIAPDSGGACPAARLALSERNRQANRRQRRSDASAFRWLPMAQPVSTPQEMPAIAAGPQARVGDRDRQRGARRSACCSARWRCGSITAPRCFSR